MATENERLLACALIEELGGPSRAAALCTLTVPSVIGWRTYGLPKPWCLYLKLKFPRLACWKQYPDAVVRAPSSRAVRAGKRP